MAVFRVEKNKGYTVMSNHHLRNKGLTLKAKGLLSQMLSLPEDWDYALSGLSHINREKVDAIRTAVQELETAGYIQRTRERDDKGRLRGADYIELSSKDLSNTDISSTHSIPIHSLRDCDNHDTPMPLAAEPERKRTEAGDAYKIYEEIIKDNIEYGILQERYSAESLDEIVDLILETVCTARKTIRIAGDDYPAELVKSKFMKLNSSHIEFVFDCMKQNTTKIRNIKKYMLAVLFNAPSTIDSYYAALFASAKAGGDFPFRNPSTTAFWICQRFEHNF